MNRWKLITADAVLGISVLLLFAEYPPGNASSTGTYDKNVSQSRTTWCDKTNACDECQGTISRPRCSETSGHLCDADLCGCCCSCVSIRDLGESCGSQLSVRPEVIGGSLDSSLVTILATTWCKEGLVCVHYECRNFGANIEPDMSPWLKIDVGLVESEQHSHALDVIAWNAAKTVFPTVGPARTAAFTSWEPVAVDEGHSGTPKTVSPSPGSFLIGAFGENRERKTAEPCHARSEETLTIFSHNSDDRLGRIEEMVLNAKRFQLVYTGDMLSELEILLTVVDRRHKDSLLAEEEVDSLIDGFLDLLFSAEEEAPKSESGKSMIIQPCREKRDLESSRDLVVSLDAPNNIEEILIRGASAHKEYFNEGRSRTPESNIANESSIVVPVETQSQGDESTVRVHITNRPRKVQTLIDLEEEGDMEELDDGRDKGRVENVGRLSPIVNEEFAAPPVALRPFEGSRPTEPNWVSQETPKYGNTNIFPLSNSPWNETLALLDDRLTRVEIKIDVVETVLEEIAKWCNLGLLSMTRDCIVPQNSDVRHSSRRPDLDERLALASGIDAVQFPGNRRRPSIVVPQRNSHRYHGKRIPSAERRIDYRGRNYEPLHRSFDIEDGGIRRWPFGGQSGLIRPRAKTPCANNPRQGVARNKSLPDSSGHLKLDRSKRMTEETLEDLLDVQNLKTLQETQIPVPLVPEKKVTISRKLQNLEEIFPRRWFLAGRVSVLDKNQTGRKKRSVKSVDGVPRTSDAFDKVHSTFTATTKQPGDLFQAETSTRKSSATKKHKNAVTLDSFPLMIAERSSEVLSSPVQLPMMNQQLFRSSKILDPPESTAATTSKNSKDVLEARDSLLVPHSITTNRNSTVEYEDVQSEISSSSGVENDFDHIYDSVEPDEINVDFDYVVPYDQVEYVDGSSVEIVTEMPDASIPREPRADPKSTKDIREVLFRRERSRRASMIGEDECGAVERMGREIPPPLFGLSVEKQDPETVAWPSKWIGYRRDRIRRGEGSRDDKALTNYHLSTTRSTAVGTPPAVSFINGVILGETSYPATTRIPTLERRVGKNRRKLFLR